MSLQPIQGFSEAAVVEVNDKINGPAAAASAIPVDKLGAVDRKDSPRSMPLAQVVAVGSEPGRRREIIDRGYLVLRVILGVNLPPLD